MYDLEKLKERYLKDNTFYTLVSALEAYMLDAGVDAKELREAVFFASWKFQMEHVAPLVIDGKLFTFNDNRKAKGE